MTAATFATRYWMSHQDAGLSQTEIVDIFCDAFSAKRQEEAELVCYDEQNEEL